MSEPVVSVLVITYNHEHFISDAVESFLKQECKFPIEIVIGDDCSSDNTQNILREYSLNFPAIIKPILNPVNLGPFPNAMNVLKNCSGKYIALCEGDDFWIDPLKLQKQVDFLEQHQEYVLSFHNVIAVNVIEDTRTKHELEQEVFKKKPEDIPIGHRSHTSSMLFRNVITEIPDGFDKIIGGDSFLQFILSRYGKSVFQKEIYPNVRRRHPQSVWSYKSEEYKLEQGIYLYEKLLGIAINKKEVKYLNKILIKNRTRYIKFLWCNHRRKESIKYLNKTSDQAFKNRLFWYLVFYNLNDLFSLSTGYRKLRKTFSSR